MMRTINVLILITLIVLSIAAQTEKDRSARKTIGDIVQKWQDDWNRHDIKALASHLAEDANVITGSGIWLRSRKEFEENDTKSHAGILKESIWVNHGVEVKFVGRDIAIAHGQWTVTGVRERDGTLRPPQRGIFTWVLEKRKGSWSIITAQYTIVREQMPPAGTRSYLPNCLDTCYSA